MTFVSDMLNLNNTLISIIEIQCVTYESQADIWSLN